MTSIQTLTMNPAIDESTSADHVVPEEKLRCDEPRFDPGGGGLNVSRAIARMDGESTAFFTCGGTTGIHLKKLLDEENINEHPIEIEGRIRENVTVLDESSEKQYRFDMPGPTLGEKEWKRCLDVTVENPSDYLVASGSLPPGVPSDFYARLARRAKNHDTKVIVDTYGDALDKAVQEGVFLIKPNMRELVQISDHSIEDEGEVISIAEQIIDRGQAEYVVVSLGAGGAMFVSADRHEQIRTPTVPIESKVGAGDSMVGGVVYGLCEGRDPLDATRFGVAAGAAAVMTPGTELCRGKDVERIYDEMS